MHIGFITSHYPFLVSKINGGIGTSIQNLSKELISLGHKVTVFVYGQENDEKCIELGISLVKIKNVKFKGISWYLTRKKIQTIICNESIISKIDLVEAPDWEGISSYINLPCPLVVRLNGSDTYFCHLENRHVKWFNKFNEKRALLKANAHLSVSEFTADVTKSVFGINISFTIIPNGINASVFNGKNYEADSKKILYFGGIIRKKGVLEIPHYFNQVIEKNPTAQLIIIGKDMSDTLTGNPSTFEMMKKIFSDEANKNVKFLGSVSYYEIKKHIEDATVCIFPSFAEAFPVSWLEAMAMGKPIVASNVGWAKEMIVDSKSGYLVDPKDHRLFVDRINKLLEDIELRKEIGNSARYTIENVFDIKKIAIQNVDFYESVISKK